MTDEQILDELYKVNNDNEANDIIEKLQEKQKESKRLLEIIAYKQQELQLQKNIIEEQLRKDTAYYTWKLEGYFETLTEGVKTTPTGTRKYKLLNGTIEHKPESQKLVKNEEELLKWIKENKPEMIKTTEAVKWAELKETIQVKNGSICTEDGEILECITLETEPAKLIIKVNK